MLEVALGARAFCSVNQQVSAACRDEARTPLDCTARCTGQGVPLASSVAHPSWGHGPACLDIAASLSLGSDQNPSRYNGSDYMGLRQPQQLIMVTSCRSRPGTTCLSTALWQWIVYTTSPVNTSTCRSTRSTKPWHRAHQGRENWGPNFSSNLNFMRLRIPPQVGKLEGSSALWSYRLRPPTFADYKNFHTGSFGLAAFRTPACRPSFWLARMPLGDMPVRARPWPAPIAPSGSVKLFLARGLRLLIWISSTRVRGPPRPAR